MRPISRRDALLLGGLGTAAAGAVLMSASTIVVALNAQLLRGLKLNPADVG
jgi:Cu2+-exporting ATPase